MLIRLAPILLFAVPALSQDRGIRRLAEELLNSPEVSIRMEAAKGLARASTSQAVRVLRSARADEANTSVRLEIVRALRTIVFQRYPGYRDALSAIDEAADDEFESNELVRLRATEALWEAGKKDLVDPVPILQRQLADESQRLRLSAVEMLRKHGTPEAADVLGRACQDKSQSEATRLRSIEAVGAVALSEGGDVARKVETANISVTDGFNIPALSSTRALDRRHERQINYLAAVARDPDNSPTLVLQAVKSMGRVKDKSAIPVLRELIENHRHDGVRKQAIIVLSHVMARQYE